MIREVVGGDKLCPEPRQLLRIDAAQLREGRQLPFHRVLDDRRSERAVVWSLPLWLCLRGQCGVSCGIVKRKGRAGDKRGDKQPAEGGWEEDESLRHKRSSYHSSYYCSFLPSSSSSCYNSRYGPGRGVPRASGPRSGPPGTSGSAARGSGSAPWPWPPAHRRRGAGRSPGPRRRCRSTGRCRSARRGRG